jgi:hypothetical protein
MKSLDVLDEMGNLHTALFTIPGLTKLAWNTSLPGVATAL